MNDQVKSKIQTILEIELPEEKCDLEKRVLQKNGDMDKLVNIVKNGMIGASRSNQIQMLTIPASLMWSRKKIKDTFNTSDNSVRKAH